MFKKITIITAALALIVTIFYGIFLFKNRSNEQSAPPQEIPVKVDLNSPTLSLPGKDPDTPLFVPNFFYSEAEVKPLNIIRDETSGSITGLLKETETYSLYAFTGLDGSSFMVSLHADNLRQARIDGEQALLNILNISQDQACSTSITVVVENPFASNISVSDVRPSFCPDRFDLPESGALEGGLEEESQRGSQNNTDVSL